MSLNNNHPAWLGEHVPKEPINQLETPINHTPQEQVCHPYQQSSNRLSHEHVYNPSQEQVYQDYQAQDPAHLYYPHQDLVFYRPALKEPMYQAPQKPLDKTLQEPLYRAPQESLYLAPQEVLYLSNHEPVTHPIQQQVYNSHKELVNHLPLGSEDYFTQERNYRLSLQTGHNLPQGQVHNIPQGFYTYPRNF